MIQQKNSLVIEILKHDGLLSMSIFEQNELASTLRHYSRLSLSFTEMDKLCQETVSILNKADKKVVRETDLINDLKKTGQLLWDHLLTRQVKDRLKTAQLSNLILSMDEELISIPWELLYTGDDFLCLKFNLGRLVRTQEHLSSPQYRDFAATPKMLILVNPTDDLKSAYLEGNFIKNHLDRKRKDIKIDFKSTHIDTLYVKKNLRDYDIVHFAGHCEYDLVNPKNSGWVLSDGRFSARDIRAMAEGASFPTLVFANACHSAKVDSASWEVDIDYQAKTYTLASAFLFSGVRHYIGSIRKIEDSISLIFAKEFYTHLISGRSVGESVRMGRLKLLKKYGITGMQWASYLLYGDPNFVLFRAKVKLPIIKSKKELSLYKKPLLISILIISIISTGIYLYWWLPTINPNTYLLFLRARNLFLKGDNQGVIRLSNSIIKKDPLFLDAYPLLADTYQRLGDTDNALKYYFAYTIYSEKKQARNELASAYTGIGWIYHLQGKYPQAFDFYNKAISFSRENKDSFNEAMALRKLAVWYIDKEDYNQALELLMKSSEINRERQRVYRHRYNLASDYFDLGLVFSNKNDFTTARKFYTKSRQLFESLKLKNKLSDYYFNLGEIYIFDKNYQKALDCYMEGLKIDLAQNNKSGLASDYNMLGELYVAMDNWQEAEKFFMQAVSISREIDAPLELADAHYNLGLLYKQKNKKDKARECFQQAHEIYALIDTSDYQKVKQQLLELH